MQCGELVAAEITKIASGSRSLLGSDVRGFCFFTLAVIYVTGFILPAWAHSSLRLFYPILPSHVDY